MKNPSSNIAGIGASTPSTPEDGTPNTILGQIHSTRRGNLLLTSFADAPVALAPGELIIWSLGDGQWYLTLGASVPPLKMLKLAADEGIDPQELIRLRDEVVEAAA